MFLLFIFIAISNPNTIHARKRTLDRFPDDFEFGTATSSYQIEGAWNSDGKGWSMWDHVARATPDAVIDQTNGDIACDSYHLYKRDVQMLTELGVKNYRFSISWPRILPYGRRDYINPAGIQYYNNLINELLAYNITPFVTMYHWDLPQNLNELGGWMNEDIVDWFGNYSRVLYENFGDRVKNWLTINEPYIHCYYGYGFGAHAPLLYSPSEGFYECGRNILLANARAYHVYDEFRSHQGGQLGFVVSMEWGMPESNSEADAQAVLEFHAFHIDYFIHPIYSDAGNYPQIVIDNVAIASARQGLNASRLRPFTDDEVAYIKGTADFLGLNHYSSRIVYRNDSVNAMFVVPSFNDDLNVGAYSDSSWPFAGFNYEYAPGLYHILVYLKDNYNNLPIYITESGCSTGVGLNDDNRVQYYRNYLNAVLDALDEGVNVKGYFAWSLMDNFEWSFGYTVRFGLYDVDIEDPNRTRTPKKSAFVFKDIISSRVIDYTYNPDPYTIEGNGATGISVTLTTILIVLLNLVGKIIY